MLTASRYAGTELLMPSNVKFAGPSIVVDDTTTSHVNAFVPKVLNVHASPARVYAVGLETSASIVTLSISVSPTLAYALLHVFELVCPMLVASGRT